ncbi:unnamed protein product, partial [Tuber aestivum]
LFEWSSKKCPETGMKEMWQKSLWVSGRPYKAYLYPVFGCFLPLTSTVIHPFSPCCWMSSYSTYLQWEVNPIHAGILQKITLSFLPSFFISFSALGNPFLKEKKKVFPLSIFFLLL